MDYLVDTNILIDSLRGLAQASVFLRHARKQGTLWISVITLTELYAGRGTKQAREATRISRLLRHFRIAYLDSSTATQGGTVVRDYGLTLPDALIAATALRKNLSLATRNIKHFSHIPKLRVHQPY